VVALALPLLTAIFLTATANADHVARTACVPGAPGPKAGVVTAISGTAWAESERCGARERQPLACGAVLHEDDHIVTDAGGNVAFEIEQAQVYVGPNSNLRVALDADGAPDLLLLGGRVRVVDPDDVATPGRRLATPELVSVGRGDTEANVPAGTASSICEYARPLALGDASHTLAPGTCAGPNFVASEVTALGVSLADAGRCDLADASRFDPNEVGAGPPGPSFASPLVPPPPPPVCQSGTCTRVVPPPPTPPPSLGVVESPAVNEPPPL
jgi:hypothetical protein